MSIHKATEIRKWFEQNPEESYFVIAKDPKGLQRDGPDGVVRVRGLTPQVSRVRKFAKRIRSKAINEVNEYYL